MNNEEYSNELDGWLQDLGKARKELIEICKAIIGDTLYKEDFFFTSAIDRSIALLDGISHMLQQRNLSCASILLRAQIDNCMRIFAAFIAEDQTSYINGFIEGKKITKMKDNQGNKMTDYYLRKRLAIYDKNLDIVYENSSRYVHLSDKAFYSSVTTSASSQYDIEFTVRLPIKEKANPVFLEIVIAFNHYVQLQNDLLEKVIISRKSI